MRYILIPKQVYQAYSDYRPIHKLVLTNRITRKNEEQIRRGMVINIKQTNRKTAKNETQHGKRFGYKLIFAGRKTVMRC